MHKEAATLASAGYQVTVVALWQPGLAQIEHKYGYRVIRIHLLSRRWKNHLLSPPIKYIEFAWRVWSLAGCEPIQVFHANDANTLIGAWLAAKRHNAKIIYDVHELETGRNFGNSSISRIYQHLWSFPEKFFIHRVQYVITVNASIANELIRLYNIHSPHVIMNCPDMVLLSPTDRLRNELSIPENQKIIIYQGRVTV